MLYTEYMLKAKESCIFTFDETAQNYLDPEWKMQLKNELGNPEEVISDTPVTWEHVEDVLKLETERRNKKIDNSIVVMSWLYELLTAQVDPLIMQEETEYIAQMMEYLKFRAEHPTKAEDGQVTDDRVRQFLQSGMSFAKKTDN